MTRHIHQTTRGSARLVLGGALLCAIWAAAALAQDPPSRVARLDYVSGQVSMEPAGTDGWTPAVVNRPFTTDDYLWTDRGALAELQLDNSVVRLSGETSFGFLNLNDGTAQIKLAQGEIVVRVTNLGQDEVYEVDTPNVAIALLREGDYNISVNPDDQTTFVVTRSGEAEVAGGGQTLTIAEGESAQLSGTDSLTYNLRPAPEPDDLEQFADRRDALEARGADSERYVPAGVIGAEDLGDYGSWQSAPGYGWVWYPRVSAGWAPYRDGHWAWIEPWGWTWVDEEPWGFAPFHYGRWAYAGAGWAWVPGPHAVRPVYAPALVAFVGGPRLSVGFSSGVGPAVAWVPLAPGELYAPTYRMSQGYFNRVNTANTVIDNRAVNMPRVYNNYYGGNSAVVDLNPERVNRRFANAQAPNAVTAVPRDAFATGRHVAAVAPAMRPADTALFVDAPTMVAPPVAPTRQSLAPMQGAYSAARPPARAMSTPVVARTAPAAPRAPFAAREQYLQQNAGRPLDVQAMHGAVQTYQSAPPPVRPAMPNAPMVRGTETPQVNRPPTGFQPATGYRPESRGPYGYQQPTNAPQRRDTAAPQVAPQSRETAAPRPALQPPRERPQSQKIDKRSKPEDRRRDQ